MRKGDGRPPGAGEVHLWLLFDRELQDARLLQRCYRVLSAEERVRCGTARDPRRYVLSRALVRTVLSRYLPIAPRQWVFTANAHGKPAVENPDGAALSFSLSHTDGLLLVGVASAALGVDVERADRRPAPLRVARHFFSRQEAAMLHRLPLERRAEYFFRCWTLKEAYVKARGLGLFLPLPRFGFELPADGPPRMHMHAGVEDAPSRWRFWQWQPRPGYELAVCTQAAPTHRLVVRELIARGRGLAVADFPATPAYV